ncbi:MAG: RNA polymerase sigma factor [Victivallaceae bacterium]|nr:RNA polymerase sigma factor [Victivallaceae bacterium]
MGNESDLKTLIDVNQAALLRYAGRLLRDDILAQDTVQVTFMKYVRNSPGKIRNPRAWLFKILRNHCLNILRYQKNKAEIMLDETKLPAAGPDDPPDCGLIREETAQLLRRSINALKPRHKEVVILKLEHGKTYKEIAQILDLTVTNVGFILHSAMNELKNNLREMILR